MEKVIYRIEILLDKELIDEHGISAYGDDEEDITEEEREDLRIENIDWALQQCKELIEMGMEIEDIREY